LNKDGGFIDHVVYCRKKCVTSALLNLIPLINNEIEVTDELEQDISVGHRRACYITGDGTSLHKIP
jgi:hypothetical protein